MKELLFFSNNQNKINEIKYLFSKFNVNILSPSDVSLIKEPKEKKYSFVENAKIKSSFSFKHTGIPCFADDSGICIEALNGGPGVESKRFLNKFKNRNDCFKYILKKINKKKNNKASFVSSICLTTRKNYHIIFEGKINGIIASKISGGNGFGYDPIFIPNGYNKTFSEMVLRDKNKISHRSIAINKLINFLIN